MSQKQQSGTLGRVLLRIRKHWFSLIGALALAAVYVVMSLYIPILVGQAVDGILGPGNVDWDLVRNKLTAVIASAILAALAQWGMGQLNNRVVYRVTRQLREDAFCHIQRLPLSYLDSHPQGELVSRVISDVDTLADGLLMGFSQLFTGVLTIVGALVIMLGISWQIALVVVFLTPVSLLLANFISRRTFSYFQKQSRIRGTQTAMIDETIGAMKVVRAFGHEKASLREFDEINNQMEKASLQAIFFSSLVNPTTRFVYSLVYAGVALTGALTAISGGITIGSLTSFLSYANQYTKPFSEISGVLTELQNAMACADRIFELMETPIMEPEPQEQVLPGKAAGQVEIRDLAFSYNPTQPLIRDFSLSVRPGQRIAIVGPTGCGKTTFINLLMGFYRPNAGRILLDGVDITKMSRQELRKNVGMVLQDTWLKAGTIRENIAMGKPEATQEEIIAAAKQAHAHSFIKRLPQGYDTPIGESGGNLSQGQKQLLCIARVMLCLPPMLFLDEATSSIDTRTEMRIQKAFNTMMQGRTSFIVAHRLSTIQEADVILVMRQGRIVEQGTHEQLLARKGFYAELYESQFAH